MSSDPLPPSASDTVPPVSKVKCQISVSADGFLAGPNQSEEHPLGEGGEALHEWVVKLAAWREPHGREGGEVTASSGIFEAAAGNTGAVVMGRNMFGPVRGPWTRSSSSPTTSASR